jgi:hypothetical protein
MLVLSLSKDIGRRTLCWERVILPTSNYSAHIGIVYVRENISSHYRADIKRVHFSSIIFFWNTCLPAVFWAGLLF